MLKAISWSQYIGAVLVLLLLYYAYVALVYYRAELLGLASSRGKDKAAGATPVPAPTLGPLMGGKGQLIARSAVSSPALPAEAARSATDPVSDELPTEPVKTDGETTDWEHEQELGEDLPTLENLPAVDLPVAEVVEDNYDVNTIFYNTYDSKEISFVEPNATIAYLPTESVVDAYGSDFTIGIAQLGDFLERAAQGHASPQDLVEQAPALANTDLLLSFFQSSIQDAQRASSHIYAGLAEAEAD